MTEHRTQGRTPAVSTLILFPFAPQGTTAALDGALRGLDYSVEIRTPGTTDGRPVHSATSAVLVLLSRRNARLPGDGFLNAVPAHVPILGVLEGVDRELVQVTDRFADFVCWPAGERELALRLERLLAPVEGTAKNEEELRRWVAELNLVGQASTFLASCQRLRRIAACDAPVLVEGETGTGKDLAARAIHYQSSRAEQPFVPVNCGALPDSLVENELFGHQAGAYTGAAGMQDGLVAQAEGGTLFLDEVEALTTHGQTSLLRFLEEQAYRPLGGSRLRTCNVRIIAASNAGLGRLAESGGFRPDLFYRLNILNVHLPPLRSRHGDVRLLAEHFLSRFSSQYGDAKRLHPATLAWMQRYHWPGNVRELESLVHREFLLADGAVLHIDPPEACPPGDAAPAAFAATDSYLDLDFQDAKARVIVDFEQSYLTAVLRSAGGNVTLAARRAGKERRAFGKLIKKHGIDRSDFT